MKKNLMQKKVTSRSERDIHFPLSRSKRSQSEIISTVLLILLVIVAIMLIASFLVNFVKERLSDADCINVLQEVTLSNKFQYNCYNNTLNSMLVQIHFGDNKSLSGFVVELGGASSKAFEIRAGNFPSEVTMYQGNPELPGKNEERTYKIAFPSKPDNIKIYPIMNNGKLCDKSDEINSVAFC